MFAFFPFQLLLLPYPFVLVFTFLIRSSLTRGPRVNFLSNGPELLWTIFVVVVHMPVQNKVLIFTFRLKSQNRIDED